MNFRECKKIFSESHNSRTNIPVEYRNSHRPSITPNHSSLRRMESNNTQRFRDGPIDAISNALREISGIQNPFPQSNQLPTLGRVASKPRAESNPYVMEQGEVIQARGDLL